MVNLLVPLVIASFMLKGNVVPPDKVENGATNTSQFEKTLMFFMGMGSLIFVPIFKSVTHLPPYLGILFALGVLWLVGNILHREKPAEVKEHLTLTKALRRIDMASVVFFIGILLAVASLSANGMLPALAQWLDEDSSPGALLSLCAARLPESAVQYLVDDAWSGLGLAWLADADCRDRQLTALQRRAVTGLAPAAEAAESLPAARTGWVVPNRLAECLGHIPEPMPAEARAEGPAEALADGADAAAPIEPDAMTVPVSTPAPPAPLAQRLRESWPGSVDALLIGAGPLTAVPLAFFAAGARRIRLTTLGFLQYLSPTITLLLATFGFHEPFTRVNAIAFGCVWTALAIVALEGRLSRIRLKPAAS